MFDFTLPAESESESLPKLPPALARLLVCLAVRVLYHYRQNMVEIVVYFI